MTALSSIAMQIDHVQLTCPPGGEERARAFFAGVLGMEEIGKPEALRQRGGCWFRKGDAIVHVGIDPDFRAQGKAHPAFAVDDLSDLAATLEAVGCAVTWDDAIADVQRFFTADPFGNRIEFVAKQV